MPAGISLRRAIGLVVANIVVQSLLLMFADWLLDDFVVDGWGAALIGATVISALNLLVWPLFIRLVQRFNFLLFFVASLLFNGASVAIASSILPGLTVGSLWTSTLVVLLLAIGTTLVMAPFTFHGSDYFTLLAIRQATGRSNQIAPTSVPGILFLQFDGVSETILREALAAGRLPILRRWLDQGSHRLTGWEADLPCQTSASQAGILFGSNVDIPAFRWLDKTTGRVFVSNHPRDAQDIEARFMSQPDVHGLLADGGVARGNIFSGGASEVMLTFSTALDPSKRQTAGYAPYFSSPLNLWRTLSLVVWDIGVELVSQAQAALNKTQPRGKRGFPYPVVRALTTTFLRDLVVYTLIGDILRGVPYAYADFVGYDEVAHHSGIRAPDAWHSLTQIDAQLDRLERATHSAPRPYHIVILSDHGQTQGATFAQRYGCSLGDLVNTLLATPQVAHDDDDDGDTWGYLNAFLTEAAHDQDEKVGQLARAAAGDNLHEGVVELGPKHPEASAAPVTVLASGNLGLIYLADSTDRLSYEQMERGHPGLLEGLARHPGIGFVMVSSEVDGPVVLGSTGINFLNGSRIEGTDPLLPFGPTARRHLLRLDGFSNVPDILVNSLYDPATEEAAAFEELIGGHGGLGGPQMHPFLVYPSDFTDPPTEIVGAEHLHRVLRGWQVASQSAG